MCTELLIHQNNLSQKTSILRKFMMGTDLKDSMLRTFGALGMIINKELAKKVMRRRASKFIGTLIADSFTVKSKWSLTTCINKYGTNGRHKMSEVWYASSQWGESKPWVPVPFPSRTCLVTDQCLFFQTSALFWHLDEKCELLPKLYSENQQLDLNMLHTILHSHQHFERLTRGH